MSESIKNRYDFILFFDVQDGNPNGDPDAGNLPRMDAETGYGLVTDVCLKRKVRNYVQLVEGAIPPFDIYVKEKAVLGRAHVKAFQELGIQLGEAFMDTTTEEVYNWFDENGTPAGVTVEADEEDNAFTISVAADADKKQIQEWLKDMKPIKSAKEAVNKAIKGANPRKPTGKEVERGRVRMCEDYYDIRTFGAVLSLKSAPNCGQVRGPIQMTFARSVDPIVALEHSITRMAVATEKEAEKQHGDNRTMGRKYTVPYALYRAHGFISPHLAAQTGFSEDDLKLFWQSLYNMFDHDHSAARGLMGTRKLVVFKHDSALGNAPAHQLFDMVSNPTLKDNTKPARAFTDYNEIELSAPVPDGVSVL